MNSFLCSIISILALNWIYSEIWFKKTNCYVAQPWADEHYYYSGMIEVPDFFIIRWLALSSSNYSSLLIFLRFNRFFQIITPLYVICLSFGCVSSGLHNLSNLSCNKLDLTSLELLRNRLQLRHPLYWQIEPLFQPMQSKPQEEIQVLRKTSTPHTASSAFTAISTLIGIIIRHQFPRSTAPVSLTSILFSTHSCAKHPR